MTDDSLKAIEARWDDTPPGPWEITPNYDTREVPGDSRLRDVEAAEADCLVTTAVELAIAELLVAARSDVPALVTEVRRLQKALYDEAFDHAACLSIAEMAPIDGFVPTRPSQRAVLALRADRDRLRGLVKSVEQVDNDFGVMFCPWCGHYIPSRHGP